MESKGPQAYRERSERPVLGLYLEIAANSKKILGHTWER